jgi:hypothetical protein
VPDDTKFLVRHQYQNLQKYGGSLMSNIPSELRQLWADRDRQSRQPELRQPESQPEIPNDGNDTPLVCFIEDYAEIIPIRSTLTRQPVSRQQEVQSQTRPAQPLLRETTPILPVSMFPVYSLTPPNIHIGNHHNG